MWHTFSMTRPIIDLTKLKEHPALQYVVFSNKSSAMSFFSQIIKIWLHSSTSSQCFFAADRLVSWPAVLKLSFFHFPYLSISLPPAPTTLSISLSLLPEGFAGARHSTSVCLHSRELAITAVIKTRWKMRELEKRQIEKERDTERKTTLQ